MRRSYQSVSARRGGNRSNAERFDRAAARGLDAMTVDNIDFEHERITVRESKTDAAYRQVPIKPRSCRFSKAGEGAKTDPFFRFRQVRTPTAWPT